MWTTDPGTGELTGQINLTTADRNVPVAQWSQARIDAEFFAIVTDLAGVPREIIDPVRGEITGLSSQTLYGTRRWSGSQSSPLLFAGQYVDVESGWAYNRFRFYNPAAGVYNAQDPLGLVPRVASAQGYVDHAAHWVDEFGLNGHSELDLATDSATWNAKRQIHIGENATSKNARVLRQRMIKAEMEFERGDEAHHMVPALLNRGKAEECRKIFDKFGLSPNDPANGEFLLKFADRGLLGHHDSGIHSEDELEAIHTYISNAESREHLISLLSDIRNYHKEGSLLHDVLKELS